MALLEDAWGGEIYPSPMSEIYDSEPEIGTPPGLPLLGVVIPDAPATLELPLDDQTMAVPSSDYLECPGTLGQKLEDGGSASSAQAMADAGREASTPKAGESTPDIEATKASESASPLDPSPGPGVLAIPPSWAETSLAAPGTDSESNSASTASLAVPREEILE